ncbi:hypothetical protein ACQPZX_37195 [Actinoplanes sp. CA-142083]|uniref:hypothetical protein n=1 Tax=Actinoplanes sp. CA-142083 TaxID=3239903 RepID=UPI003D91135E
MPVDLSRPDGAATLLAATADLDVGLLVSNAGGGKPGRFLDQEPDDLRQRLTLNAVTHAAGQRGHPDHRQVRGGPGQAPDQSAAAG